MSKRKHRGYMHRQARKAARAMRPDRALARYFSGGKRQTWGAIFRAAMKAQPPQPVPMRPVPWGSPLPRTEKSAQKSRAAAGKQAAQPVIKKTARGKQVAKRKAGGKFDGSYIQRADLTTYNAAKNGNAVIQQGEPNRRRW